MKKEMGTLGMFDIVKGFGMLFIIFGHTMNEFDFGGLIGDEVNPIFALLGILVGIGNALMPAFFIMSGYGFRVQKFAKSSKKLLGRILPFYALFVIVSASLYFLFHYLSFGWLPGSVEATKVILLGLILVIPDTRFIGELPLYFCGPAWYLIGMTISWILLQAIENYIPEKAKKVAIVICMVIGYVWSTFGISFFSIPQGLLGVGYMYIGYQLRLRKSFNRELTKKDAALLVASLVISVSGLAVVGNYDSIAGGRWGFGPLSVLVDGVLGAYTLHLFVLLGTKKCIVTDILAKLGRFSYIMFIMHSIEIVAVPWYRYREFMGDAIMLGFFTEFVFRIIIILVGCAIIYEIMLIMKKSKRRY